MDGHKTIKKPHCGHCGLEIVPPYIVVHFDRDENDLPIDETVYYHKGCATAELRKIT